MFKIFHDFFAYDIGEKELDSTFIIWVKFQKNHNYKGCTVGK